MGCCQGGASNAAQPQAVAQAIAKQDIIVNKPVEEIDDTAGLLARINRVGTFQCKIVTLMALHNYYSWAREKRCAENLLVFDVTHTPE